MKDARKTAFDALLRVQKDAAYSNLVLDSAVRDAGLPEREASLASALFYGVLERSITLDYALSAYLRQPVKKLKPEVLVLLRLGAYQLLYMDRIPASAAVNETVNLAKWDKKTSFAAGLINGVLRSLQRGGVTWPDREKELLPYLQAVYSCPVWLAELLVDSYGEDNAIGILKENFGRPPLTIRVNTQRVTADELIGILANEGVEAERAACADALLLNKTGSVENLTSYQDGLFHVQDLASQYCCAALDTKPGDSVLDVCSAPGGKAFTIAQMMKNKGKLTAMDLYPARTALIAEGAARLGLTVLETAVNDARVYNPELPQYDKVLCDVPCSGLGIIRRKPEIRLKSKEDIDKLPDLQYLIMGTSIKYVKPGGRFVYSTCTIHPQENEKTVARFLNAHPDFRLIEVLPELQRWNGDKQSLTLLPHLHGTDGFFIAVFERMG